MAMRLRYLGLLVLLALAVPAGATTYVMMEDGDLADGAEAIVYGRVVAVEMAPTDPEGTTRYRVEVERVVKGALATTTVEVDVPGGLPRRSGSWAMVWGVPRFQLGDRALFFIDSGTGTAYGIHQLLLGAFYEVATAERTLALRPEAAGAQVLTLGGPPADRDRARDLVAFIDWLEARERGDRRPADYFVAVPAAEQTRLAERFQLFTLGARYLRRFDFDDGGTMRFDAHKDGQPGMAGGGLNRIQRAMNAWNSDPDSNIRLAHGTSTTVHRRTCDPPNSFTFDDPYNDIAGSFDCATGGVVAIGGGCVRADPILHGGYEFLDFFKGFIVTQDGVGCLMGHGGGTTGEEVFTHELGHTLGLGHSCGGSVDPDCDDPVLDDAQMRPFLHGDGRGGRLGVDDRNAVTFLYFSDDRAGWWRHVSYPGYRFQIEIVPGGGAPIIGAPMTSCIDETVCVSGAIPGRAEVFTRIIGPRANGKLWPTLVKFTTSEVIIRIEQIATGVTRTYRLNGARPGVDELPGLFDREGFDPP